MSRGSQAPDVIVISQLPPPRHGSTLMTGAFLRALDDIGVNWRLVDRRFSRSVGEVGRFRVRKVFSAVGLLARLGGALLRQRPRIAVLFATTRVFSFVVDWALSETLRLFRVPTLLYLHTIGFTVIAERNAILRHLVKRLIGSAQTVVVLGDELAPDVRPFVRGRIRAIANTLPELPPANDDGVPIEQRRTVLFLSNLVPGKGHDDFLDAAMRCLDAGIDASFVLAGAAEPSVAAAVQDQIATSGYQTRITYLGEVDSERKWTLLLESRMLVFPSSYEAYGLVMLEALACGVPVVGYRTGALTPLIDAAGAGRVLDVGDLAGMVEEILHLIQSDQLARTMSRAAIELYGSTLSPDRYAAAWAATIRELIDV